MSKKYLLVILGLFIVLSSLSVFGALFDSIDSYYSFDNNSAVQLDKQFGDRNGFVQGAFYSSSGCVVNGCYNFTTTSPVDYVNFSGFSSINDFSLSFWFNSYDVDNFPTFISNVLDGDTFVLVNLVTQIGVQSDTIGTVKYFTVPSLKNNTWYHVAVVHLANGSTRVFLNGSESSSGSQLVAGTFTFNQFGRYYNGVSGGNFNGSLDEFAIFNKSLSNTEISALYLNGVNRVGFNPFIVSGFNSWNGSVVNDFVVDIVSDYNCFQLMSQVASVGDGGCNLTYNGVISNTNFNNPNVLNAVDGDYNTLSSRAGGTGYLYVNYSKPSVYRSFNYSVWRVKAVSTTSFMSGYCFNGSDFYQVWSKSATGLFLEDFVLPNSCSNQNFVQTLITCPNGASCGIYDVSMGYVFNYSVYDLVASYGFVTSNIFDRFILYDVNISTVGYFNQSFSGLNVSSNLNVSLFKSVVNLNSCSEKISNNSLVCVNQSIVYPNPDTYNFVNNVSGYYGLNKSVTVSLFDNRTLLFEGFFSNVLSLNSSSVFGYSVGNCSYNVSSLNYSWSEVVVGSPNSSVNLINGSYEISDLCNNSAYAYQNVSIINSSASLLFNIFLANSINFSFFDSNSHALLSSVNISFNLVNNVSSSNYTTSNGSYYVYGLGVGSWFINYFASGFADNTYFFSVDNNSFQSISLLLQNSSSLTLFKIIIRDQNDNPVTDVVVRLQEQFVNNSLAECETNELGVCYMYIEESTSVRYRFIIIQNSVFIKTTEYLPIITLSSEDKIITIRVDVGENLVEDLQKSLNLFYDFGISGNVSNFEFIDGGSDVVGGCLQVFYRLVPSGVFVFGNSSCVSGFSGDIFYNFSSLVSGVDVELKFIGVVNYSDKFENVVYESKVFMNQNPSNNRSDSDGLLLTVIVYFFVCFISIWISNIYVQIGINVAVMVVLSLFSFNLLGLSIMMGFLALGIFINWQRRTNRGQY